MSVKDNFSSVDLVSAFTRCVGIGRKKVEQMANEGEANAWVSSMP